MGFRTQVRRAAGLTLAMAVLLAVPVVSGCSFFTVDDGELERAIVEARGELESGKPDAAIRRLRRVARHRSDSVVAREMLVEACLSLDTIESRRYAEELLHELIELDPAEPRYRYQLATLLLKRGFQRYALEELERLLDLAPDHPAGYQALADYHRAQWHRYNENSELQAMAANYERAARLDPSNYEAGRQWIMSQMLIGDDDGALVSLETGLQRWPDDARLQCLAATCWANKRDYERAAAMFERALDTMNADERRAYLDLKGVADPHALAHLRDLPPGEHTDFLRSFWKSRDPTPTTRVNERLVEHYRRVTLADVYYAIPRLGLRGYETARGEVLVRYGEPLAKAFYNGYVTNRLIPPAWVHTYLLGDQVFDVTFFDYALNGRFYLAIRELPTFVDVAAYTSPEAYVHDFGGRWLNHAMETAAFLGDARTAREELYVAVNADLLADFPGDSLRFEAVAFDGNWEEIFRHEEYLELDRTVRAGLGAGVLVHQVELPLRPGTYQVASMVEASDSQAPSARMVSSVDREVTVPAFDPDVLGLSELELAYDVYGGFRVPFAKGDLSVIPNATRRFDRGELLFVYFEIYGLQLLDGRSRYQLRYRIRPSRLEGGFFGKLADAFRNKTFIEAELGEEAAARNVRRHLGIDVSSLRAGEYEITVEVVDLATGRETRRSQRFERTGASP